MGYDKHIRSKAPRKIKRKEEKEMKKNLKDVVV